MKNKIFYYFLNLSVIFYYFIPFVLIFSFNGSTGSFIFSSSNGFEDVVFMLYVLFFVIPVIPILIIYQIYFYLFKYKNLLDEQKELIKALVQVLFILTIIGSIMSLIGAFI